MTNSTSGAPDLIGNPNGDGHFVFCPNSTGVAQISICDSNVNTWLYIRGPGSGAVSKFDGWLRVEILRGGFLWGSPPARHRLFLR